LLSGGLEDTERQAATLMLCLRNADSELRAIEILDESNHF